MIVLDTTVLVYATGAEHPFREPCRRLIEAISAGVEASTTVEVIQEFVQVRAKRSSRAEAVELGLAYADLLAPLLAVSSDDLRAGLAVFSSAARVGAFDAVLAAVALASDATLVSADAAFGEVEGLRDVVPDADGLSALLQSG